MRICVWLAISAAMFTSKYVRVPRYSRSGEAVSESGNGTRRLIGRHGQTHHDELPSKWSSRDQPQVVQSVYCIDVVEAVGTSVMPGTPSPGSIISTGRPSSAGGHFAVVARRHAGHPRPPRVGRTDITRRLLDGELLGCGLTGARRGYSPVSASAARAAAAASATATGRSGRHGPSAIGSHGGAQPVAAAPANHQ